MTKYSCTECEWHGEDSQLLRAQNPFADDTDTMVGCPECREPNSMRRVCDEPECWLEASCGTPTPTGYRTTCGKHKPCSVGQQDR